MLYHRSIATNISNSSHVYALGRGWSRNSWDPKVPVSYRGSTAKNYLEIIIDVAKGLALGNNICNSVMGKADVVTVDLGFVIEAREDENLPEHMLVAVCFHHLNMKSVPTHSQWNQRVMG